MGPWPGAWVSPSSLGVSQRLSALRRTDQDSGSEERVRRPWKTIYPPGRAPSWTTGGGAPAPRSARRSAAPQRLQRDAGRHTERWLGGLRQRHAHGVGAGRTGGLALGSIALAAGRPDGRQSFPGRGARLRRGLNVVADLAAEPGGGGGGGAPAPNAEPAGRGDAQPEEERILISEARGPSLTMNELVGPCLKQEQAVRCRMRPMQALPRKAHLRRAENPAGDCSIGGAAADGGARHGGRAAARRRGRAANPAGHPLPYQGAPPQVEVRGVEGELRRVAEAALSIKPNFGYTLKEVQDDVHRVFDSGFFEKCHPHAEDTRDGVKLTVEARPRRRAPPTPRCPCRTTGDHGEGCSTSLRRARWSCAGAAGPGAPAGTAHACNPPHTLTAFIWHSAGEQLAAGSLVPAATQPSGSRRRTCGTGRSEAGPARLR